MTLTAALDVESTGLNTWKGDRPFNASIYFDNEEKLSFLWPVDPFTRIVTPRKKDIKIINEITMDRSIEKVIWNKPFDSGMLNEFGVGFNGPVQDAMIAFKCLISNEYGALKPAAKKFIGISDKDEKKLASMVQKERHVAKAKGWKIATPESHPDGDPWKADYWLCPEQVVKYNLLDSKRALVMWLFTKDKLEKEGLWETYEMEMQFQKLVTIATRTGTRIRRWFVKEQVEFTTDMARKSKKEIYKLAGEKFNINSTQQLGRILFKKLKQPYYHTTDGGAPSTAHRNLIDMKHPIAGKLIEYHSYTAGRAFFANYLTCMSKRKGVWVVHPNIKQLGARTSRMSCTRPNLQNVRNEKSVRSDVPINVKGSFGPRKGHVHLHFDYSQIEVWLLAADAKERYMLENLVAGRDIHGATALKCWPKLMDKATKKKDAAKLKAIRTRAKALNFGVSFGAGVAGIAYTLGMRGTKLELDEAQKFIDDYRKALPKLQKYQRRVINRAIRKGYIRTLWGRKLRVNRRLAYQAINYRIQGSAAEMIKRRSIALYLWLKKHNIKARILMWVHDEVILEIEKSLVNKKLVAKMVSILEHHEGMVPGIKRIPINVAISKSNWGATEKYEFAT